MLNLNLPGSSQHNAFNMHCYSHDERRPSEGGCELRPNVWVCSLCWKRGFLTKGAANTHAENNTLGAKPTPHPGNPLAQTGQPKARPRAADLLALTRDAWGLAQGPSNGPKTAD